MGRLAFWRLSHLSFIEAMSAPITFALCADDYGISPAVSAGIRDLPGKRRLSAAGLMPMRHPGYADAAFAEIDRVVDRRKDELAYLESDAFLQDIESAGLRLGRFSELGAKK